MVIRMCRSFTVLTTNPIVLMQIIRRKHPSGKKTMETNRQTTVCIREYRIIKKRFQKNSRKILQRKKTEGRDNRP